MAGRGRRVSNRFPNNETRQGYQRFLPAQDNWQQVKQPNQSFDQLENQVDGVAKSDQWDQAIVSGLKTDGESYSNDNVATQEDVGMAEIADNAEKKNESQNEGQNSVVDENGKLRFNKIFKTRKKPSVRAKEKKLRQNRQLRRAIFPKNALMAMNELKGLTISEFTFNMNESGGFIADVTVNGKQHKGKGSSKMAAKNAACESVLRDFVIAKMIQKPRHTKRNKTNSISSGAEQEQAAEAMEFDDATSVADSQAATGDETDELPMVNIASFALYKLFSEWEREGFTVPELHPNDFENSGQAAPSSEPVEPKHPPIRTELPKNWETMHPATLLCMMRPGLSYTEYGSTGEKSNVTHRLGVVVDGKEYIETGRSKKLARKNVAITVCNSVFGTNFVKEEPAA